VDSDQAKGIIWEFSKDPKKMEQFDLVGYLVDCLSQTDAIEVAEHLMGHYLKEEEQ
jgi:hypothetical protein